MNVIRRWVRIMLGGVMLIGAPSAWAKPACPALALDVHQMPVQTLLAHLAATMQRDVIIDDAVRGEVSLHLGSMSCEAAWSLIIKTHHLVQTSVGSVRLIQKRETAAAVDNLAWDVVPVRHAHADQLARVLEQDEALGLRPPQGKVQADTRTNQLILRGRPEVLQGARQLLARLDQPLSQVQIEARIVVVREHLARQLGIQWQAGHETADRSVHGLALDLNAPAPAHTALGVGFVAHRTLLHLQLNALESEGHGHTLSQPRIVTAERQAATIRQGQEVPYQETTSSGGTSTRFRDAVLSLGVTPTLGEDQRISLALDIQNDSISDIRFNNMPAIDTNRIQTQVAVKNGETIALGGILTQKQVNRLNRTPWLGELPWVGALFRTAENAHEKVELLVFITPHIVEESRVG